MGWHRDDEAGCLGDIASLSLGAVRRFAIDLSADYAEQVLRESVDLANGSLLVFDGRQRHCLRATKRPVGMRINLTFRNLAL
jgi:alkylated DNA repair dioxygenase AlkB